MVRYFVLAFALVLFMMLAVTLIVTALICVALACAVGIPLYLMSKPWLERHGVQSKRLHPIDRLKNLYVEGKIDLFEFERRVARLISIDH